ncbi:AMP-binding protein [Gilvimarinus agarilyticus]|uniref:AMP-binding protein n=1 Tax=Gilvimarinus agarilyticus TaxID=679259 RepID=UPI000696E3B4|nr:AMP-binding protein [Gilvimarinus agarilyticus]
MNTSVNIRDVGLRGGPQVVAWTAHGAVTADQLRRRVLTLAAAIAPLESHRVALWQSDSYDFLSVFLALALSGKQVVLPHNLHAGSSVQMAQHFDLLISDQTQTALDCPQLSLNDLSAQEHASVPAACSSLAAEPVTITLFTSGSTGVPQPVHKTLSELEAEVAVLQRDFPSLGATPVVASVSHHHIYGLLHVLLWPLVRGAAFVVAPIQFPENLVEQLAQHGPAVWVASPTHLARIPASVHFSRAAPQLSEIFSSGGLLSESAAESIADQLGYAPIEVLGSTETGGVAWRRQTASAFWQPLSDVVVAQSDRQCLHVKSQHLNAPEGFEMGDKVHLCNSGEFQLLGRVDTVVKVEGKRLSLTELEARLNESPWVGQARAAVVRGRRDEVGVLATLTTRGEQELRGGKHQLNTVLRDYLADFFDRPLLPRRWRYFDSLPSNAQGKLPMADIVSRLQEREK